MNRYPYYIVLLLLLIPLSTYSQFYKRKLNTYDKNGNKSGLWITYYDEEQKILSSKYHYKDGHDKGVCKLYHPNGKVRLKFRHQKNRIRVKYFSEDRKLDHKGWAKKIITEDYIDYFWEGEWKYYNSDRKLVKTDFFVNGVSQNSLEGDEATNDN